MIGFSTKRQDTYGVTDPDSFRYARGYAKLTKGPGSCHERAWPLYTCAVLRNNRKCIMCSFDVSPKYPDVLAQVNASVGGAVRGHGRLCKYLAFCSE